MSSKDTLQSVACEDDGSIDEYVGDAPLEGVMTAAVGKVAEETIAEALLRLVGILLGHFKEIFERPLR